MREIKFRGFNSDTKEMFELKTLWLDIKYRESISIMQYTGIKDILGKDIYEGDVCLANGTITKVKHDFSEARKFVNSNIDDTLESVECRSKYIVYWHNKMGFWGFRPIEKTNIISCIDKRELEVIGNIYENPELCS